MRSMAHIETILEINPIENADAIEVATILGWKVVVKKNQYTVGQKIVYCEIDSWIPESVAPYLIKAQPAKVCKPLRFIAERTRRVGTDIKGNTVVSYGYEYHEAVRAARRGDGATVQRMAMGLV